MNLKEIRKQQGLTQRKVAFMVGLKPGSYCDIENGKKGTKPATAMKIAEVLGFSWTEFYEEANDDVFGDGAEAPELEADAVAAGLDEGAA